MTTDFQALNEAVEAVRFARLERERAITSGEEAAAKLKATVRAADKAGVPKTEIAEYAGVSRQTVYDLLAS